MTIERREHENTNRRYEVVMTECALCGEPLPEHVGFANHVPNCPEVGSGE